MLCAAEAVGGPRADRHRVDQGELEEASYLFNRQVLRDKMRSAHRISFQANQFRGKRHALANAKISHDLHVPSARRP